MSTVIPFDFEGNGVRVVRGEDGETWFVAADVCRILEHGNSRQVVSRLDEDEKGVRIVDTLGGLQEMTVINESGLYSLALTSRKPAAKRFKKWVTSEVLPSIRKTGGYGQVAFDFRAFAEAVEQTRRIDRNAALDMVRRVLPTVAIGAHRVAVLPNRPLPSLAAAGVLEQLQRAEVTWWERAGAYEEMLGAGHTIAEVANLAGRTRRHVQIHVKMRRELSPGVLGLLADGRMRANHARALVDLPHAAQDLAAKLIVKGAEGWRTYRQIRGSLGAVKVRG